MSKLSRLRMALGARSYDILVGEGLLADAASHLLPHLPSKRAILISDETVAKLYGFELLAGLRAAGIKVEMLSVPAGESSKSFAVLERLMEEILALTPDRKTTLIALGGGVVGDLVGFAASILLRGVPFIQIPTTLLAQVDSSVGGKTAINARAGKNLIGSFYQPQLVLADLATLKTLPARAMRAGYAEVIKYGLIMNPEFYDWCIAHGASILAHDALALADAVSESCRMKAEIVGADERESAARALLNFGHTFGHALEAETGMSDTLLHGEAVAIGMVMACRLSARMGLVDEAIEAQLTNHLRALGLWATPSDVPGVVWNVDSICRHFVTDKKAESGALTFIVLDALGKARVAKAVDAALARDVVHSFIK